MSFLSQVSCTAIQRGELPVSDAELAELHPLVPAWNLERVDAVQKLSNSFNFDDNASADRFVKLVQEAAEREGKNPEVCRDGRRVTISWWSPEVSGVHPNDFIMAAKTDGAYTLALVGAKGDMFTDEPLPTLMEVPRFRHLFADRAAERRRHTDEIG